MDPRETYLLMSERFYDSKNNKYYLDPKLEKYLKGLYRKNIKTHYKYKNLKGLEDLFFRKLIDSKYFLKKYILKLENDIEVTLNIDNNYSSTDPRLHFSISRMKNKKVYGNCVSFIFYPFKKLIYLNSLLYTGSLEKIVASKECNGKNIPEKSGEFFLKLIEDIAKTFSISKILLEDASSINYEKFKISLPLFYLQKNGSTYYGKFKYKPVLEGENRELLMDISYDIPLESLSENLVFIKKELKKIPLLNKENIEEWIKKTHRLLKYLPDYYIKYL